MKKYYCKEENCNNEISKWNHNYGMGFCRSCAHKDDRNPMSKEEYRNKLKGKNSSNWKGGWNHFCLDCGKKIDFNALRCKRHAKIYQYLIKPETHPFLGKHHTKSSLKKISKASKSIWKNLDYRDKAIKAQRKSMQIYPNKPEKIVKKLLAKISKDYKYTGNGSFVIDGFNPDFTNINSQKKLIEIYGTYWHKRPEVIKRDIRRIRSYKKHGYKTLIIWEHELKNIDKVIKRIERFIK